MTILEKQNEEVFNVISRQLGDQLYKRDIQEQVQPRPTVSKDSVAHDGFIVLQTEIQKLGQNMNQLKFQYEAELEADRQKIEDKIVSLEDENEQLFAQIENIKEVINVQHLQAQSDS